MSDQPPTLFAPGTMLERKYRLERLLGQGGMGSVWLAENQDIGRRVAIKFLLGALSKDQEIVARFRLEARAAAAIGHPGIVDVLDMGQLADGTPFIVMEQLLGETLGARLGRLGPFALPEALWVFERVADAVGAAHAKGVIHRDLKPDNLFLVRRPVALVKVLDFGVSKFKSAEDLSLTRTGMTMGTPLYMSPEQARGAKNIGIASDCYALGAIFYHLLTGAPPFTGDSYNALLARVLTEPHVPLAQHRPDLPEPLLRLVDMLLEKNAEVRPGTAQVRATVDGCYRELGLPKDAPRSIVEPPGLEDEPPPRAGAAVSDARMPPALRLSGTSPSARRASAEQPLHHSGLAGTSPSQRRASVETPLPADPPGVLDSTSPSQRRASVETPRADPPGVVDATSPSQRRASVETPAAGAGAVLDAKSPSRRSASVESPSPAQKRNRAWVIVPIAVALALAGGLAFALSGGSPPTTTTTPTSPPMPPPAVAAPAPTPTPTPTAPAIPEVARPTAETGPPPKITRRVPAAKPPESPRVKPAETPPEPPKTDLTRPDSDSPY